MQSAPYVSSVQDNTQQHTHALLQRSIRNKIQKFQDRYKIDNIQTARKIYRLWKTELRHSKQNYIGISTNFARATSLSTALTIKNELAHIYRDMKKQHTRQDRFAISLALAHSVVRARKHLSIKGDQNAEMPTCLSPEALIFKFDLKPSTAQNIALDFSMHLLTAHALYHSSQTRQKKLLNTREYYEQA